MIVAQAQSVFALSRSTRLRLLLGLLLLLLSTCVVFYPQPDMAREWIRHAGYYFTLLATLGLVGYLLKLARSMPAPSVVLRQHRWGVVGILVGSWVLFVQADFGYKIAMDEYLLAQTAVSMHESREVTRAEWGRTVGREFVVMEQTVDKRPWFYPFMVASLHDLIGYRPSNPFVVNALAAGLFLCGVYVFATLLAGRAAGVCAVLLWSGLPLLAQNATGAGMDLLNLLLLQCVLLLSVHYLQAPDRAREGALSMVAVLLAYTRYESLIFVLPVGIVILLGWWRTCKIGLSVGTLLAAPLLIGLGWQVLLYAQTESAWELQSSGVTPFGIAALVANIPHAVYFFFSWDHELANSCLLAVLGLPSVVAFYIMLRTEWVKFWKENPAGVVLSLFGLFLILHLIFVLSFHAAQLDSAYASRFALPVYCLLVFSIVAIAGYLAKRQAKVWSYLILLAGLFIISFTMPMNAKAVFSKSNFLVNERNWLEQLSRESFEPSALVVDRFFPSWILLEKPALEPSTALLNSDRIREEVTAGKYPAVYLVERMTYQNGEFVPNLHEFEQLRQTWNGELLAERSFRPFELTRVYRCVPQHVRPAP